MFVRTKDNRIIEVENEKHLCSDNEYRFQYKGSPALIKESTVVKSSDNVEELVDEYVLVFDKSEQYENELFSAKIYTPIEALSFYKHVKIESLYGAIWTDKGLIYVAKMNDKGGWELC